MKLHAGDSVGFFMLLDSLKQAYPGQFDFKTPAIDTLKYLGFFVKVDSVFTRAQVDTLRARETRTKAAEQAKQQKIQDVMNSVHTLATLKEPFLKDHNDSLLKPGLQRLGITSAPDEDGIYFMSLNNVTGPTCQLFQKVSVKYTGTYLDGTMFDSNELVPGQQLLTFTLGLDQMIPGFTKCIYKMHPGEKAVFVLPSAQAYRDGLTRVFTVEVVSAQNTH
jgi:FKBP-type peptidyl-prolyl cis-trans isomerase